MIIFLAAPVKKGGCVCDLLKDRFLSSSFFIALGLSIFSFEATAADNLKFKGTLVQSVCTIAAGDETVDLDFGDVIAKDLYINQRTAGKPFQLKLSGCKLSTATSVGVTFSGSNSTTLPGLLIIPGDKGIALGLEDKTGVAVPLDTKKSYPLTEGNMVLNFKAYIQAEPLALADKNIVFGDFSTTANFAFTYE